MPATNWTALLNAQRAARGLPPETAPSTTPPAATAPAAQGTTTPAGGDTTPTTTPSSSDTTPTTGAAGTTTSTATTAATVGAKRAQWAADLANQQAQQAQQQQASQQISDEANDAGLAYDALAGDGMGTGPMAQGDSTSRLADPSTWAGYTGTMNAHQSARVGAMDDAGASSDTFVTVPVDKVVVSAPGSHQIRPLYAAGRRYKDRKGTVPPTAKTGQGVLPSAQTTTPHPIFGAT